MRSVTEYVRNGSSPDDGLILWTVGTLLHWRSWALGAVAAVALVAPAWIVQYSNAAGAAYASLVVGYLAAAVTYRISPKYNLEKNY